MLLACWWNNLSCKDGFHIIKIKHICALKDVIWKVTKQPTEWEKQLGKPYDKPYMVSHIINKGLVPRIYKVVCKMHTIQQ